MSVESRVNGVFISSQPDLPGAFPETPDEEAGPRRNKLHKRNDPRGWTGSQKQARGHGHTDSGVGLEPGRDNAQTYEYNAHVDAAATRPYDQPKAQMTEVHENGVRKPGFFTGAFSRIGNTADHGATVRSHNTAAPESSDSSAFDKTNINTSARTNASGATRKSSRDKNEHVQTQGPGGTAALAAGAALTSSGPEKEQSGNRSEQSQHNIVRNGRDRSEVDHSEQYRGDIPPAGGVYNTVVGAGSDEKAPEARAREHSLHPSFTPTSSTRDVAPATSTSESIPARRIDNTDGKGVHNGVIGAGSAEDKSAVKHQRAFPLVSPQQKTAAARGSEKPAQSQNNAPSKFKENIAGVGAGVATGHVASQYSSGQEDRIPVATDSQRGLDSAAMHQKSSPYTQKHISDIPKPDSEDTKTQHHHYIGRDAAVAGAGAGVAGYGAHKYTQNAGSEGKRAGSQDYAAMYQTGNPYIQDDASSSSAQTARADPNRTSLSGRNAALAGGAAIGGYGAYTLGSSARNNNNNNTDGIGSQPEADWLRRASSVSSAPGSRRGSTVQMHAEKLLAQQDPDPSRGGTYNVLADGTPSGVNLETARRRSSVAAAAESSAPSSSSAGLQKSPLSAGSTSPIRIAGSHQGPNHSGAKSAVAASAAGAGAALAVRQAHQQQHTDENGVSPRSTSPAQTSRDGELSVPPSHGRAAAGGGDGYVSGEEVSPMSSPKLGRREPSIPSAAVRSSNDHAHAHSHGGAKVAAAGVGAGAAGTAAHRAWARHDNDENAPSSGGKIYRTLADGTPSGVKIEEDTAPSKARSAEPGAPIGSEHSSSKTAAAAAAAGAVAVGAGGVGVHALNHSRTPAAPTATEPHPRRRSSSVQYKVLASGTPSGIDLSQPPSASEQDGTTSSMAPQTAMRRQSLPGAQQKKKTARFSDDDLPSGAAAVGAGAGVAAAGSAVGKKPLMHKCSHCGKEDDVSEYLRGRQ